jgi:hypothetical protein
LAVVKKNTTNAKPLRTAISTKTSSAYSLNNRLY